MAFRDKYCMHSACYQETIADLRWFGKVLGWRIGELKAAEDRVTAGGSVRCKRIPRDPQIPFAGEERSLP